MCCSFVVKAKQSSHQPRALRPSNSYFSFMFVRLRRCFRRFFLLSLFSFLVVLPVQSTRTFAHLFLGNFMYRTVRSPDFLLYYRFAPAKFVSFRPFHFNIINKQKNSCIYCFAFLNVFIVLRCGNS